jgi:hypothetical protein
MRYDNTVAPKYGTAWTDLQVDDILKSRKRIRHAMQSRLPGQSSRSSRPVTLRTHAQIRLVERTALTRTALQDLLDARKCVPLGLAARDVRALLVYSAPDDRCFVVLENFHTRKVITVLPLEYWRSAQTLTENSAEAWQARSLALAADEPVQAQLAPVDRIAAPVIAVPAPEPDAATKAVLRVQDTRSVLLARLIEREEATAAALTQTYASPEEQIRVTDTRFFRLAGALEDIETAEALMSPAGRATRRGKLVLTLLRNPPEFELNFPRLLLCEEAGDQLRLPAFIAGIARKLVSRRIYDEDVKSVHLMTGTRRHDFPVDEQRAFLEACASAIAAAWPKD